MRRWWVFSLQRKLLIIVVGRRASLEIIADAPSYWSVTFTRVGPDLLEPLLNQDLGVVVISPLFLVLQEALMQWGAATCGVQGWCMRSVGFVGVFSVVCWIFKFAVFSDGRNSQPTKCFFLSGHQNDQLWFNQLYRHNKYIVFGSF